MAKRWPLRPAPIEGEALSSWVERILLAYPDGLRGELLNDLHLTDTHSIDKLLLPKTRSALTTKTGICSKRIQSMTLAGNRDNIWGTKEPALECWGQMSILFRPSKHSLHENAYATSWRGSNNRSYGMACSRCLTDDETPHIRLSWTLPILASCPVHRVLLRPMTILRFHRMREFMDREWMERDNVAQPETSAMDMRTWTGFADERAPTIIGLVKNAFWLQILRGILSELAMPMSELNEREGDILRAVYWYDLPKRRALELLRMMRYEDCHPDAQQYRLTLAARALQLAADGEIDPQGQYAGLINGS